MSLGQEGDEDLDAHRAQASDARLVRHHPQTERDRPRGKEGSPLLALGAGLRAGTSPGVQAGAAQSEQLNHFSGSELRLCLTT